MKNADIAAAITLWNGAWEVTTQDMRSWRIKVKIRGRQLCDSAGGGGGGRNIQEEENFP
jgi:hypothetical protein